VIGVASVVGPTAYWYLARGTGAVALLLLSASVVLGVLGSVRFSAAPRWPRFAIDTLHRDVSLIVLVLLVVHIVTSVLDGFAPIGLIDGVIPLHSSYRPLWLGLGALSFDLLLALVATSLARRRLGYSAWRAIHWLAYASWPVAVLHGLGTGSDTRVWWMLALSALCVAAVVAAIVARLHLAEPTDPRVLAPAAALTFAATVGIVAFTVLGPLQRGWSRRAGTPASLLSASAVPSAVPSAPGAAPADGARNGGASPLRGFSARVAGEITQKPVGDGTVLDISVRLSHGERGTLRVRMAGAPIATGGLTMTGSQVDLALLGRASVLQGQIVSLRGAQFLARVTGADGVLDLRADLKIDNQSGAVSGSLVGGPAGSAR
jgi:methionine sulfoxide reductase heme-binding subunit